MAQAKVRSSQEKDCLLDCRIDSNGSFSEGEHLVIWATEELRKQQEKTIISATDKALAEETMWYASGLKIEGERGVLRSLWGARGNNEVGPGKDGNGCWDLVEFTNASNMVRGGGVGFRYDIASRDQEGAGKGNSKFSDQNRKRRERIHSKELLEKSKFERELKRLEYSINNEKGNKQKGPSHGKGDQIAETKIQPMSENVVRSLGSGRFLDWRALDVDGAAGGLLICWDERSLEILDWEEGQYSLSCRFKNVEDGVVWVFTGVYGPFTKEERECLWEEIGAIRGIWEEPWCLGDWWIFQCKGECLLGAGALTTSPGLDWTEGGGLRRGPCPFRFGVEGGYWEASIRSNQPARSRESRDQFSENEIHSALMEMNGDKALGLDGFTMAFWQSCWEFVKVEILEMFKEFHEQSSFLKSLNNTFLVLIPKKGGAVDLGDFRPISLLGGLYKLLAKVLANRLKRVLSKVGVVFGVEEDNLKISHLFFADDTVVFCEANKEHLTHLSWILFWFEAASSLRINLDKSEIIPVGVVEEIDEMAVELGCRVGSLPSQYLGLPLGAPNKAPSVWDEVKDKLRRRLAR
ncbi:hypothetical protein CK203_080827 [Vitis vinifera]|uniref:Uncharacterized protein n=1 Tax=Vitis vinifera TaxID=29760 RepID=A0A438F8B4_VITVI|nr:hypothetical protein CK203_080827 [Vitis vinifera]